MFHATLIENRVQPYQFTHREFPTRSSPFRPLILSPFLSRDVGAHGESLCGVRRAIFSQPLTIDPSRTGMGCRSLQVHEWLILLDREVENVWRSRWGINKILFIVTRYGPFLDMPVTITSELGSFTLEYR